MKRFLILPILFTLCACNPQKEKKPHEIEKANWFLGSWENKIPQGHFTEYWENSNDSVMRGSAYFTVKNDTQFYETVELKEVGGILNYVAKSHLGNDTIPVAFQLTKSSATELLFENQAHDYPTKIRYKKITRDSIVATISGIQQGKPSEEVFGFKRQNPDSRN